MGSPNRRGFAIAVLTAFTGALCSAAPAHAALASPTANAYVASADAIGSIVAVAPVPVSNYPPGGTTTQVGLNVGPFITSSTLTAKTAGDPVTGTSSASATVQTIKADFGSPIGGLNVVGDNVLNLTGVNSHCEATPSGATGDGVIAAGTVVVGAGVPIVLTANAAPNTVIPVGALGQVTLNEQSTDANGVLTINAVHLEVPDGEGVDNVILGHVVCGGAAPAPTITKKAAEKSFVEGETIHYTFTVTNNGTEPLTNIAVTDNGPGSPTVTCPPGSLAPGASVNCTASYTATAADVAAGEITDTGTVTADLPDEEGTVTGVSEELTIPLRALSITKSAIDADFKAPGETVHYTYTVTNTGQAPLTDVTVTDLTAGVTVWGCGTDQLAPGETTTCQATYTTTAADVAAGTINDQGRATGTAPGGEKVTATSNTVSTPLAALSVVKTSDLTQFTAAGQTIHYTYKVTNNGTQTLSNISVVDTGPGSPTVTCPVSTLEPGEWMNCTASYTTTQADVAAGKVVNGVTVTGTTPNGSTLSGAGNTVSVFKYPPCDDKNNRSGCEGEKGHGDKGRGDKGQGDNGRGDKDRGDKGRGEKGHGEKGKGDKGHGEKGKRDKDKGDKSHP
ncbi:choice-of-anchor P family protein [Streptomyces sp. NPDC097981]|uniref:choice-of-anchor P family protein n=1 Tax=Streptomyces sp. NPDC097981 TaxID=3155428 RepID=UPI0033304E5A